MQFLSIRGGVARALDEAPPGLAPDELLWVDCHYHEARAWVPVAERLTGATVFEDHLLDAESPAHPSYFDSTQHYELIVFRGLALPETPSEEADLTKVRSRPTVFFVLPGCLVTVRAADSRTAAALRTRLLHATPGGRQRLPESPEALMLRLLNSMVDRYLELRNPLTAQLDRWQRRLLDPRRPFRDWYGLLEARSELRKLEQLCEEQLDALQEWLDERAELAPEAPGSRNAAGHAARGAGQPQHPAQSLGPLPEALQVRANDVVNHVQRVLAHARRLQDSLETAVQLHFSSTAHRTNEIMRTLTTITAIFMPLTLITGIFGMNFEFIPGLHARAGFWLAMGAMALVALGLFGWFRARRYLDSSAPRPRQRTPRAPPGDAPRG
jgi:Mg2+ and Co2+ transporter CorA